MKVKIAQSGFETYTGLLVDVYFQDGVSVTDITESQKSALGSIMLVENVEGGQVGIGVDLIRSKNDRAEVAPPTEQGVAGEDVKSANLGAIYTRADLEEIADKDGIVGLRTIADKYEVRSKNINGLIEGILSKSGSKE